MSFYPSEKNVGSWDRLLRLVVGPVLLVGAVAGAVGTVVLTPLVIAVSAIAGAILTVTGLTQKCPMNQLLGVNTYRGDPPAGADAETPPAERPL